LIACQKSMFSPYFDVGPALGRLSGFRLRTPSEELAEDVAETTEAFTPGAACLSRFRKFGEVELAE
jgi:hypothetical protein